MRPPRVHCPSPLSVRRWGVSACRGRTSSSPWCRRVHVGTPASACRYLSGPAARALAVAVAAAAAATRRGPTRTARPLRYGRWFLDRSRINRHTRHPDAAVLRGNARHLNGRVGRLDRHSRDPPAAT
jgi:hypothetical protein